ncbi:MAG TPA: polysaccharide biosynthesis C-terminal domain-containing protein [Gaiellaceae bacterium]|nr:polysaccharide biosynthesis C-terminal domain-containing protein [Gaiellaceae bacterium]
MSATEKRVDGVPPPTAEGLSVRFARALGVHDAGRALRHFTAYLPTQLVPALAGFIVLPVLARRLTPTELGVLAIAQTLITLGWTAAGSWIAISIVRLLPRHRQVATTGAFSRTLTHALGLGAVVMAAFSGVLAAAGIFSDAIGDNLLLIVAAAAGLVLQNLAVSILRASLRPRAYAVVDVLARTGGVGLGVLLVFADYGVQGYLAGLASASLLVGSLALATSWPRAGLPAEEHDAELGVWLRYGVPASLSAVATWALAFVDRYLLALLENTGAVGVYSVGNVIGDKAVAIPAMAFLVGSGPLLITAYERSGRGEVERLMRAYTRFILLIGAGAAALVTTVATILVPLLVGGRDAYLPAADVVPFVALGALLYALALVGYTGLVVARRTWPMVHAAVIGVGVNVVANLLLIPRLGIVGAAIATPIGTGTFLLACQVWSRRYATWRFPWATLLRAAAAGTAGFGVAREAIAYAGGAAAQLGIALVVFSLVYLVVLALVGERRVGAADASS